MTSKPWPVILMLLVPMTAGAAAAQVVVMPSPTNAVQLRLYTDGSANAVHLFNTFELEAYGELLLASPPSSTGRPSWLVDGHGPSLDSTNSLKVVEEAAGDEWRFIRLDGSAAYRERLTEFKRGILFVAPDLFVIHDHLVAKGPARLQTYLEPPAGTRVDPVWHDLRYESTSAWLQIQAPGRKHELRGWTRLDPPVGDLAGERPVMELAPPNTGLAELDVLIVLVVEKAGVKTDCAFKLLESISSVGARIHRNGLPTLVAFRVDPAVPDPSLTGFAYRGPVGVDVFRPVRRPARRQ